MKQLILNLPDELSAALSGSGQELSRAALEAIALEAYRERKLTAAQLRRILGFETRINLTGFSRNMRSGWSMRGKILNRIARLTINSGCDRQCRALLSPTRRLCTI